MFMAINRRGVVVTVGFTAESLSRSMQRRGVEIAAVILPDGSKLQLQ